MPITEKTSTDRQWEIISQWAKPNITGLRNMCTVGKDALAVAFGCHIVLYNVETGARTTYTANSREKGDGVSCIAGHRTLPFLAFAEKSLYPRLLVFPYPSLEAPVSVMKGGALQAYEAIVFSETEYLITLTGIPEFNIMVWTWRNGVKVACKPCGVEFLNQSLSMGCPILLCQSSPDSKQLIVWELNVSAPLCCLSRREIALPSDAPPPLMSRFLADGGLVYIDILGNLYQVNIEEFNAKLEVSCSRDLAVPQKIHSPWFVTHKNGVIISGINGTLKSLKRGSNWEEQWTFQSNVAIVVLENIIESDTIFGWTEKGELVQVKFNRNPPEIIVLNVFGANFIDAVIMTAEPWCVVSISTLNILQAFDRDGQQLCQMDLVEVVRDIRPLSRPTSLSSNPRYPYIAVTMSHGLVLLVSLIDNSEPTILAKFLLCDDALHNLKFLGGNLFATVNVDIGRIFLLQGEPGGSIDVIGHILLGKQLVEIVLTGDQARPILVHMRTEPCCQSGNIFQILNYEGGNLVEGTTIKSNFIYNQLVHAPSQRFYATPHHSRKIHLLRINLQEGTITNVNMIVSGQLSLRFWMGEQSDMGLLTYGVGGITIDRPPGDPQETTTIKNTVVIISHFRSSAGVKRAMKTTTGNYVMTLGADGTLILNFIKRYGEEPTETGAPRPETVALFKTPTLGFFLEGDDAGLHWLEYQEKVKVEAERRAADNERTKILSELETLQKKISEMLDANESGPPEERLPLSAFDLDKEERENDMEQARVERELLRTTMVAETTVLDRLSDLIIKECWEKLSVKPTTITSFTGATQLDNYPMYPESAENKSLLESTEEWRKLELKFATGDSFHPWVTQDYVEEGSASSAESVEQVPLDEKSRMMEALMREEVGDGDATKADEESSLTLTGSTAYRFVDPSKYIITQMELNTYLQTTSLIVLLREENRKLMTWFNEQFNQAYAAKEREMSYIKGLHEKIRHIFTELRVTCGVGQPDQEPKSINWTPHEQPQTFLTVRDSELSVRPYGWVPPSDQQEDVDDEEAIFRKKALMNMMGGVLEVRWEDELKKDVPKPKFMLEKDHENYTEDEVRQFLEYKKKVEQLQQDREHYRKILLSQYRKVKFALKESSIKFEQKLASLRQVRLNVDGASVQTFLRIKRSQLLHTRRYKLARKEKKTKEEIAQNQKMLAEEQAIAIQMLDAASEIRSAYDAQVSRDRYLDIRFRKEFPDVSTVQMELLQRAYRRRPKMRATMSSHLLLELGRFVITAKKPAYLSSESLEFLKSIDAFDSFANTPINVNADLWANLCRLRRQRIESELKVKAMMLQIVEADNTVAIMHRSVRALKERDKELNTKLKRIQEEQLYFERDIEIQLVLKQGIVEIPMNGRMEDYENCVMIDRTEVAKLNDVILEAGKKKLQAMRSDCNFRRGIIFKEWEHRKMVMRTEDKEDELNAILSAKVPKEGQEWLAKKLRGITDDKFSQSVEKEIANIKTRFEKYIRELAAVVRDYDERIQAQNKINEKLQTVIKDVNVQVKQLQADYDPEALRVHNETQKRKMELWLEKSSLVIQVREIDIELSCLRNELEVLQRRYYPTLRTRKKTVAWSHS